MTRKDLDPPRGLPMPHIERHTESRETYLKGLLEQNSKLPDFDHLKKYPDTWGTLLGPQDVLETAIENFQIDRTPQVIVVTGHHGNGKSTNAIEFIRYIKERTSGLKNKPQIRYVGYDEALTLTTNLVNEYRDAVILPRVSDFNPDSVSGTRTHNDYDKANHVFEKAIRISIGDGGIIIVEAPADGGIESRPTTVGKDRGTTVVGKLARRDGFYGVKYNLFVAALVANEELYRKAVSQRFSEAPEQTSERPGATGLGQSVADEDLKQVLAWHFNADPSKFDDLPASVDYIAAFFVWQLRIYFGLKSNQSIVLQNSPTEEIDPPKKKVFKKYNQVRKMSKGRKIGILFDNE